MYKLDLLEREPSECAERLQRYLGYLATCDGQAIQAARSDYRNVARGREVTATLPRAWEALLQEQDSLLLELLADKVEDICGYKPELDVCGVFLEKLGSPQPQAPPGRITPPPPAPAPSPIPAPRQPRRARTVEMFSFSVQGQELQAGSAREVMTKVFELLAKADPSFLERFAARKHGKKRRYLAMDRAGLYPGCPDLAEIAALEIAPGWWLGTNYSRRDIQKIINLAREVVDPSVGESMRVTVDE